MKTPWTNREGLAELAAVLLCLIGLVIGVIWKILKPGEENRDR